MEKLLEINNIKTIAADDNEKEILKGLNLEINKGEMHYVKVFIRHQIQRTDERSRGYENR